VAASLPVVLTDGTNTYVYGLDLISSTVNSTGTQTYYLYDGLGSTVNLTSAPSGSSTQSYSYDVFGATPGGPPPGSNQWLFTGEQRDADSGLYYLRARHYDQTTGRFLGRDPFKGYIEFPHGQHPYAYAFNNPVSWADLSGEWGISITAAVGAAVGGTAGGLSTLAVDILNDGKINTSWEEYGWNIGRGAVIGGACGSVVWVARCVIDSRIGGDLSITIR
jgi:RHS repeat-associated protein